MKKRIFSEWHVVAIPLAIYVIHASFFREWIVDDAGISFAYARNLAEGYGLVSQPGSTPIEGFSNFLWTMILVPFLAMEVFHPVAVPKILGLLFVGASYATLPKGTKLSHASVAVLVCMLLGFCALDSVQRSATFLKEPVVDFRWVAERYGKKLNNFADALDLKDGSALLADIGGALYCSRIRIHDLAGLCDKTIARTLRRSNGAFRDYVFHELRPTFIHTHGYWTLAARFFKDGRFSRDYVPIDENVDEWIMQKTGQQLRSGYYVRREVVERDPGALARLRAIR
jgi:hypothetical protein